jgi:transcriptional regulator with XRE-family HTH domain
VTGYPRIIEFLGTDPWPEPETPPQKLQAERYRRGLNVAQAAAVLGVDPSTVWWWEAGRGPHLLDHRRRIAAFLATKSAGPADAHIAAFGSEDEAKVQALGDTVRRRRRYLGLTLEGAARFLGVSPWTLMNWEHDRRIPTDRYYPALIEFLGCEPWPTPATLAERLRASRLRRGLSQEQAAVVMQVSSDSISDWESGRVPRHHLSLAKIDAFLSGAVRPRRRPQRGGQK